MNPEKLQPKINEIESVDSSEFKFTQDQDKEQKPGNKKQDKIIRKYKMYLSSPSGKQHALDELNRSLMHTVEEKNADFLSKDPISYMQTSSMGIHDYSLELNPTGDIKKDAELLFKMINADKLVERINSGENPSLLLVELQQSMKHIVDNSEEEEFKKVFWKAIEVMVNIEDILQKSK